MNKENKTGVYLLILVLVAVLAAFVITQNVPEADNANTETVLISNEQNIEAEIDELAEQEAEIDAEIEALFDIELQ